MRNLCCHSGAPEPPVVLPHPSARGPALFGRPCLAPLSPKAVEATLDFKLLVKEISFFLVT